MYRAVLKDNFRKITPQPFRAHLDHSRPIAKEYIKAFKGQVNNALKTNPGANALTKGLRNLGYAGLAYDIYNAGDAIYNADNKGLETTRQVGRIGGSIAGGTAGAELGAAVGVWFGGEAGQQAGEGSYNAINGNDDD